MLQKNTLKGLFRLDSKLQSHELGRSGAERTITLASRCRYDELAPFVEQGRGPPRGGEVAILDARKPFSRSREAVATGR